MMKSPSESKEKHDRECYKTVEFIHCNKCESSLVLKPQIRHLKVISSTVQYFEDTYFCPKCQKWRNKATMHYSYDDCCKQPEEKVEP